jgi:hypothetical protein
MKTPSRLQPLEVFRQLRGLDGDAHRLNRRRERYGA